MGTEIGLLLLSRLVRRKKLLRGIHARIVGECGRRLLSGGPAYRGEGRVAQRVGGTTYASDGQKMAWGEGRGEGKEQLMVQGGCLSLWLGGWPAAGAVVGFEKRSGVAAMCGTRVEIGL